MGNRRKRDGGRGKENEVPSVRCVREGRKVILMIEVKGFSKERKRMKRRIWIGATKTINCKILNRER